MGEGDSGTKTYLNIIQEIYLLKAKLGHFQLILHIMVLKKLKN